jgi:hypothetical protein
LVGDVNEASTSKNVYGDTITATSKLVGHVNEASTSKNVFGSTITAGTKLVGDVNESGTTNVVYGNTITAGTGGFVDSNFINKGVIYYNSTSGKLVSTAASTTTGQVIKSETNGFPVWGTDNYGLVREQVVQFGLQSGMEPNLLL